MLLLLSLLGLVAGVLTTLAGMGGGLMLLAVLTVMRGPHLALALSSPALFVSNSHRAYLFRNDIDRRLVLLIGLGALPGALLGGLVLPTIPDAIVTALLVATTVFAVLRAKGYIQIKPRAKSLAMAGAGVGALSATSGGAGMLLGPILMSAGLTGAALVATIAACAATMHIGRVAGYFVSGLLTFEAAPGVLALLVGLVGGNLAGRRLRSIIPDGTEQKMELFALVASTGFALIGLVR
ncbi:MAG: sulfite exporter TauE/SafE family protein [Polyangiaceae bacterium]|nr:sulfite exporter TauE/SafE family protein [Polyangiaceae bacterium]